MVTYAYATVDQSGNLCVQETSHIVQVTKHQFHESVDKTMNELNILLACGKHERIQSIIGPEQLLFMIRMLTIDGKDANLHTNVVFLRIVRLPDLIHTGVRKHD